MVVVSAAAAHLADPPPARWDANNGTMMEHADAADGGNVTMHLESVWERSSSELWLWTAYLWSFFSPYVTKTALFLFLFPVGICLGIYFSAFCLYLGRERGYEVVGMEHIPDEGPALIVYYHGALPVDYYYFFAKVLLTKNRIIHSIVDRFLFLIPGLKEFLRAFQCHPGSVERCCEELKAGHIVGVSPGGVYEAQFSTNNYEILWKDRMGVAKIALAAKCKVLPMFTSNLREAFRTVKFLRRFLEPIYSRLKLPLMPIWGGFPVKLTTYIGPPIEYDPETTSVEELRDKIRDGVKALIDNHQKRPGSLGRALYQRLRREGAHVS